MGGSASEGAERLPLAKALLASERPRSRQTQDAPPECVSRHKSVCRSSVLGPVGVTISPIASIAHVPAGATAMAPAERRRRRLQPAYRTMVRQCATISGAAPVGRGHPIVLVAVGGTRIKLGEPLPREVVGASAGLEGRDVQGDDASLELARCGSRRPPAGTWSARPRKTPMGRAAPGSSGFPLPWHALTLVASITTLRRMEASGSKIRTGSPAHLHATCCP